jgi:hypothetical protein
MMFDPAKLSDEEKKLLEEIAKANGQTIEETLVALGHGPAPEPPVTLEGVLEVDEPVLTLAPAPELTQPVPEQPEFNPQVVPDFDPPPAEEPPTPPAADEFESRESSGVGSLKQICVQCGWDQDVPTIPEPEYQDKIAFLHCVLGQKVFSKKYALFGNNLKVTFRTLTIREIDMLYQETFKAQKLGLIQTTADYYEYLNRQRLYLQLIGLISQQTAMHIRLPDGLDKSTHPDAELYWEDFLRAEKAYKEDGESLLMQVQDYIITKVLRTEQLQRTVTHTCNKFNRLVAKLESCVDDPNFWNETELQS